MSGPAKPNRPPSWKKARRRSYSPYLARHAQSVPANLGRGPGGEVFFPRAGRVLTATRLRTARELWDLLSPTSIETAAEICRAVAGSKFFVDRLIIDRPPARARWKKALRFDHFGTVIAFMYAFYLAVALAITLPVLLIAFCLDLPRFVKSRLRRLRRQLRRQHRRRRIG